MPDEDDLEIPEPDNNSPRRVSHRRTSCRITSALGGQKMWNSTIASAHAKHSCPQGVYRHTIEQQAFLLAYQYAGRRVTPSGRAALLPLQTGCQFYIGTRVNRRAQRHLCKQECRQALPASAILPLTVKMHRRRSRTAEQIDGKSSPRQIQCKTSCTGAPNFAGRCHAALHADSMQARNLSLASPVCKPASHTFRQRIVQLPTVHPTAHMPRRS